MYVKFYAKASKLMILDAILNNSKSTSNADTINLTFDNNHQFYVLYNLSSISFRIFLSINFLIINRSSIDQFHLGWPQGWVSDMSGSPTRSNPRIGQKFLSDESDRVLAIVRRSNPTREIVRNLRLDKIR